MKGFGSAIRTLTILPFKGGENEDLADSLYWFPAVGFVVGLVLLGVGVFWQKLAPSPWAIGGAALMVALEVILTRGLHLDGLADWADSIGGFGREKRLSIMKDVSVGAFGSLAMILDVLFRVIIYARLMEANALIWVLVVSVISRDMLVELITTLPYARSGQGMAGPFIAGASREHRVFAHCLCVMVCLLFGPVGIGVLVLGWCFVFLFSRMCSRQFGGITGDLLGTAHELVSLFMLMFCAFWGPGIMSVTGWFWLR